MNKKFRSPNYNERSGNIKYLIMHYTGMATGAAARVRLCQRQAKVSAHYLIEEDGEVFNLVDEKYRAWHAGLSKWHDDEDINDLSIGIEIVNEGHPYAGYESVYKPFPDIQMNAVLALSKEIIKRYNIKPWHVLGHSDVAPGRKIDPGELFNWKWLAQNAVGLYAVGSHGDEAVDDVDLDEFLIKLEKYGYNISGNSNDVISAFQRHFRQDKFDGILDHQTATMLESLLKQKIS